MFGELLDANVFDPLVSALLEEMRKLGGFKREEQLRQRVEAGKEALNDRVRLDELDDAVDVV